MKNGKLNRFSTSPWINFLKSYLDIIRRHPIITAYPVRMFVGTSTHCNLKCIMCGRQSDYPFKINYPPSEKVFKLMSKYFTYLLSADLFGFGEPFLENEYFEKIKYLRSIVPKLHTTTNGTLLDTNIINNIIDSGMDVVGISIDAATPKTYSEIRPGGEFNKVISNIKNINKIKKERNVPHPKIYLCFCIMKQNINDLPKLPGLANELQVETTQIRNVNYYSEEMRDKLAFSTNEYKKISEKFYEEVEKHKVSVWHFMSNPNIALNALKENKNPESVHSKKVSYPLFCQYLWNNTILHPNGDVQLCCFRSHEITGNIMKNDLKEIMNSSRLIEMRQMLLNGEIPYGCEGCCELHIFERKSLLQKHLNIRNLKYFLFHKRPINKPS